VLALQNFPADLIENSFPVDSVRNIAQLKRGNSPHAYIRLQLLLIASPAFFFSLFADFHF
jgi:hypothetical protein